PLMSWYRTAIAADWKNLAEVKAVYPHADLVGDKTVFNLKGNHYRLIVYISYQTRIIYIKDLLTHADYDKGAWK
ncbi:MAG: type II toxin-antitoxin system HigB family toxin, partial [Chloroflexota bacterium]